MHGTPTIVSPPDHAVAVAFLNRHLFRSHFFLALRSPERVLASYATSPLGIDTVNTIDTSVTVMRGA